MFTASTRKMDKTDDTLSLEKAPCRKVELPFGVFELYPRHVVSRIQEGVNLDRTEVDRMCALFREHFGERGFGYLSIRDVPFSVNPMESRRIVSETSVVAGAFVMSNARSRTILQAEVLFYKRPVLGCESLEEAEAFLAHHLEQAEH